MKKIFLLIHLLLMKKLIITAILVALKIKQFINKN